MSERTMQRSHQQTRLSRLQAAAEQIDATDEASIRAKNLLNYKIEAANNRLSELASYGTNPDTGTTLWGTYID